MAYGSSGNGTEFVSLDLDNLEGRTFWDVLSVYIQEDDRGAISSDAY